MLTSIDFSDAISPVSNLDGAAQKRHLIHEGKVYIVKFGETLNRNPKLPDQGSYQHAPISEHIGCAVFRALGIPVQNTLLGTFQGREVVACEDFIAPYKNKIDLVPFSHIENTILSSGERDRIPHFDAMTRIFENAPELESVRNIAQDRYWDTFVVDAIIANPDRHSGNWGYIAIRDEQTGTLARIDQLAPVYDCGSSLAARISEDAMARIVNDDKELKQRAYGWPMPALAIDGRRMSYHDLMLADEGKQARAAYMRLADKIDTLDMESIVNDVPGISDIRREFYVATVRSRIEHILEPARELALNELKNNRHTTTITQNTLHTIYPDGIPAAIEEALYKATDAATSVGACADTVAAKDAYVERLVFDTDVATVNANEFVKSVLETEDVSNIRDLEDGIPLYDEDEFDGEDEYGLE